jgi:predicted cupin superfamily sugar epimerase
MQTAKAIISALSLEPHPEGGYFRETFRDSRLIDGRAASTAIYYLLPRGDRSHWHRVDAAEVWHWYAGAPLALTLKLHDAVHTVRLGSDFSSGEQPQYVVRARVWQSAKSLGEWSLMGCTVAPGFQFQGFDLAPKDWAPA